MSAQAPALIFSQTKRLHDLAIQEVPLSGCDSPVCASHSGTELDESGAGGVLVTRRTRHLSSTAEQHDRRFTHGSDSAETHIWFQAKTVPFKDPGEEDGARLTWPTLR
jgi:hypothetical protein